MNTEKPDAQNQNDKTPTEAVEVEELRAEAEALRGKYQRALADFQNYQRRSIQNEQVARRQAVAEVVRDLLPALDNLDLVLAQEAGGEAQSVTTAVKMAASELQKALARHGVVRVEAKAGDEFDPVVHEAVTRIAAPEIEPGRVAAVFQAGYMIEDMMIRSCKVAIAQEREGSDQE